MIERDIVKQRIKEFQIKEHVAANLRRSGYSNTKLQRTPLGEKVIVYASRPGLVVGRQGSNIRQLTDELKSQFELENPQIEVGEVENVYLDANIVSEMIALSLERFGTNKFKGVMHRTLENVLNAGALGVEIILSGKLPSARARSWRVYGGYLKKCGDISISGMRKSQTTAQLRSGIVGIKVNIMPPDIVLPDKVKVLAEPEVVFEEITSPEAEEKRKKVSKKKRSGSKAEKKDEEKPKKRSSKRTKKSKAPDEEEAEKERKSLKERKAKKADEGAGTKNTDDASALNEDENLAAQKVDGQKAAAKQTKKVTYEDEEIIQEDYYTDSSDDNNKTTLSMFEDNKDE
ncbi:30S ribosomal protein S3 [Candidatus Woesearchaeota archaeon]|nr:30S ribosomal protein S3 [Candidatus Woesearchaeota archaeon]